MDAASRTIVLPSEKFWLTQQESETVTSARWVAQYECLVARGVEGQVPPKRVIPEIGGDRRFGVWVMADAEQWGYLIPQSPEKKAAVEAQGSGGSGLSEAEIAIAGECAQTPVVSALRPDALMGPWQAELSVASEQAQSSPAWGEVIGEYHRCLREYGLEPQPDSLFSIEGVDSAALDTDTVIPADVAKAITDVGCKDQVNLVQRLADLQAQAQAPVVARHLNELQGQRAELDKMLIDAAKVLREHGL